MSALYIGLALLLAIALGLCVLAFRSRRVDDDDQQRHRAAQRDFYQQRQRELQADADMGLIDGQQLSELRAELDKQLLEENSEFSGAPGRRQSWPLIASLVLLVLASVGLYHAQGYHQELALRALQQKLFTSEQPQQGDIEAFESLVEDILQRRPDTAELLVMMASIRRQQGDYAGAIPYYQRLVDLYPDDADVLAQLAQARYLAAQRQVDEETRRLLDKALSINPRQATALGVVGIDAFAAGEYANAVAIWQRLLSSLPGDSSEAMVIASGLNEAKKRALEAGSLSGLAVDVSLAETMTAPPQAVLFVVARAGDGNPMPVAALRLPLIDGVQSLPQRLYLTDSDVIRQGQQLTDFDNLQLSAHISLSGTAMRRQDDLVSSSVNVMADQLDSAAQLVIDHKLSSAPLGPR